MLLLHSPGMVLKQKLRGCELVSMISTSKQKIKFCRQFDDTTDQLGGRRVRQVLKRLPGRRLLLI